jgi:hypothetical protein
MAAGLPVGEPARKVIEAIRTDALVGLEAEELLRVFGEHRSLVQVSLPDSSRVLCSALLSEFALAVCRLGDKSSRSVSLVRVVKRILAVFNEQKPPNSIAVGLLSPSASMYETTRCHLAAFEALVKQVSPGRNKVVAHSDWHAVQEGMVPFSTLTVADWAEAVSHIHSLYETAKGAVGIPNDELVLARLSHGPDEMRALLSRADHDRRTLPRPL